MHFTPNQIVVSRFSPINTRMVVVAHLKSGVKVRKVDEQDRPFDRPIKVMPFTLALPDEPFYNLVRCTETVDAEGQVTARTWSVVRTVAGLNSLKLIADTYADKSGSWYYELVDHCGRPISTRGEVAKLYE